MENESRIKKTIKNTIFNFVNQIVSILLQFILRTVFIHCLALEYLGINGLFNDVLTMLSLTELGLGAAIICSLYKPLAEKNEADVRKYFYIYKKVYCVIGMIVFLLGMSLLPFLDFLVKDAPAIVDLKVIYFLFLLDSVASYFFAHYRALLSADQKDYVNANNRTMFLIIQLLAQILVLFVFHNYLLFMLIKICCNCISSYVISIKVKKLYPFIQETSYEKLSVKEMYTLRNDTAGVFISKIGMTVLNSTDNIIISSFIGSIVTAYYSNYSLLIGTISTAMGLIFSSVQASIGNYCNSNSKEESYEIFCNLQYIYFCIYGFSSICLVTLASPFIKIWLGSSFVLENSVVIVIVLKFYLSNVRQIVLNFLTVNHLAIHLSIKTIIETILNIGLSIILVRKLGITGIFVGTGISLLVTSIWYEPYVLFKRYFQRNVKSYFAHIVFQVGVVATGTVISSLLVKHVFTGSIVSFVFSCIIVVLVATLTVVVPFLQTKEFDYLRKLIKSILVRKGRM